MVTVRSSEASRFDTDTGDIGYVIPTDGDPEFRAEVEKRTVSVPLHDRVRTGTLPGIAEDAEAKDFDEFCKWIDRNR